MRVISGTAKGRKLQTIEGDDTRPTTDRMKETIFNMIAFDLPQCDFLDVFAGSGAMGIEALSRGASSAIFIDYNPECQAIIRSNLLHTKLEENAVILKNGEVVSALSGLQKEEKRFHIIFLDPPYESEFGGQVLQEIATKKLLAEDGYVLLEHDTKKPVEPPEGMELFRQKTHPKTTISFYRMM